MYRHKMPISKKYRSIFIHIPKNAGESIEKTLGMYRGNPEETLWGVVDNRIVLQHLSAERLRGNYIDEFMWKEYLKFSVVRNPWSKAVSEYHWYLRFGPAITFSEWVGSLSDRLRINEMINVLEIGHNVRQNEFLCDQQGNLLVDKVLRFEDLSSDFSLLSEERNWGVSLMRDKATKSTPLKDFRSFYTQETAQKICDIYSKDISLFGYSMNETFSGFDLP